MNVTSVYERYKARQPIRIAAITLYLGVAAVYLVWRATVLNPEQWLFSLALYGAELSVFCLALTSFFLTWKVRVRDPIPAPPGLEVDVLIPTYNESVEMLRLTVQAALEIEYPHETWLLDDGRRPEMKALAEELGCHYLTRPDNVGNKAGNMNHALGIVTGEFVVVIDSDHVAQRNFLHRTLGYFQDPKLAFVQSPQDFYNLSAFQFRRQQSGQRLWQDQSVFYGAGQLGRDHWNATTCCGTSVVFRRAAIDSIGGFPPETVTEDMHMSIKMQKLGWSTAYHPEALAYGVAPADYDAFLKQRLRWGQGNVQSFREEWVPFSRQLTWAQKLCYSALAGIYVEGWARLVFYVTPVVVLLTGVGPVRNTEYFMHFFVPYILCSYLAFEETTRGNMRPYQNEQLGMARFPVYIASTFGLFFKHLKWRISSKEFVGHFPLYLLLPQITVLAASLAAIATAWIHPPERLFASHSSYLVGFVSFWAGYNAWMALAVMREAWAASKNKRPDYRFEIPLPLEIAGQGDALGEGIVEGISTAGMTFSADLPSSPAPGDEIAGTLYLPSGPIPFRAQLARVEARGNDRPLLDCDFLWDDAEPRDRLDLSLHSCAWHRRFIFQGGFFETPSEKLARWLGLFDGHDVRARAWRTALVRDRRDPDATPRFAMLAHETGSAACLAFGKLEPGATLDVRLPLTGAPRRYTVLGEEEASAPGAVGLDAVPTHVYRLEDCS